VKQRLLRAHRSGNAGDPGGDRIHDNPVERKRLQNQKYLETLADGIVVGVERYMKSLSKSART